MSNYGDLPLTGTRTGFDRPLAVPSAFRASLVSLLSRLKSPLFFRNPYFPPHVRAWSFGLARRFGRPTPRRPVYPPYLGRVWCFLPGFSSSSRLPRRTPPTRLGALPGGKIRLTAIQRRYIFSTVSSLSFSPCFSYVVYQRSSLRMKCNGIQQK